MCALVLVLEIAALGLDSLNGDLLLWKVLDLVGWVSFCSSPYLCLLWSVILLRSRSSFSCDLVMPPHHLLDSNVLVSRYDGIHSCFCTQSQIHGSGVGQASEETQITTPTMHPNLVQIRTIQFLLSRSGSIIRFRFCPLLSSSSNPCTTKEGNTQTGPDHGDGKGHDHNHWDHAQWLHELLF